MERKRYNWEETPIPVMATPQLKYPERAADIYTRAATAMCLVHNMFIRVFNSIYLQAQHVPPSEYGNFIGYALLFYTNLEHHHRGEEERFFRRIAEHCGEVGVMEREVGQHAELHQGLEMYAEYLRSVQSQPSKFSGTKLVGIMDSFVKVMEAHLSDEISTLLSLTRFGDKIDMTTIMHEEGEKSVAESSLLEDVPMLLLNLDRWRFEGGLHKGFPPVPGPMRWLVCNVFTCWNWGWWKFATCDGRGMPRELPYGAGS
ncbi:hypothetical protein M501DRAFT_1011149 [Patellaria atrata CBS 101060]|uniref:Hemerythrin-like domain-containing protein n=1 Tax=Patellaria atrata CBS 101060 TaxID=1346257 RepID=A0A9P4SAZ4_9PEZI|nr:hypothetical protein M501DRAFT_1011149 [Patellaria atrata CBS 101060]